MRSENCSAYYVCTGSVGLPCACDVVNSKYDVTRPELQNQMRGDSAGPFQEARELPIDLEIKASRSYAERLLSVNVIGVEDPQDLMRPLAREANERLAWIILGIIGTFVLAYGMLSMWR